MKKIIKIESFLCDCCGAELREPGVFRNDGSYQKNFFQSGKLKLDLCFTCAGKVFDMYIVTEDVNEYKIREYISSLNPIKTSSFSFFNPFPEEDNKLTPQ